MGYVVVCFVEAMCVQRIHKVKNNIITSSKAPRYIAYKYFPETFLSHCINALLKHISTACTIYI